MISIHEPKEVTARIVQTGTNFKELNVLKTAGMGRNLATKLVMTALTMERGVSLDVLELIHFITVHLDQIQLQLFVTLSAEMERLLTLETYVTMGIQRITRIARAIAQDQLMGIIAQEETGLVQLLALNLAEMASKLSLKLVMTDLMTILDVPLAVLL